MDARFTKAEAALLLPEAAAASRRETEVETIRLAAAAARNEAFANWLLGGLRRAIGLLASLPQRVATYNALSAGLAVGFMILPIVCSLSIICLVIACAKVGPSASMRA